jgi:GT2 family glycosyltransferase
MGGQVEQTGNVLSDLTPIPVASVVMPTHGRRTSLVRVLRALADQQLDAGAFEVIVVCDGDIDGSVDACRGLAPSLPYQLRILEQDNEGPAAARNRGIDTATGELIVFLDDDVLPDPTLIADHLAAHAGRTHVATIGPLLHPADSTLSLWGAWEQRMLSRQYDEIVAGRWQATYRQFYTGNAAVRKRDILAAGGFDPSFKRAEDVELALRLQEQGTEFVFLPTARGLHYVQRTFKAWLRVPAAYAAADVAMAAAGRPWILPGVAWEFQFRRRVVRTVTLLCAGRAVTPLVISGLGSVVRLADRVHLRALGDPLCSLIFNLEYYSGLAEALGGRELLLRLLRHWHIRRTLGLGPDVSRPEGSTTPSSST